MVRNESRYQGAEAFLARKSFNRSNIISDGCTIYSYGSHFPMARHTAEGTILVNEDRYSRTTSKHQSALWGTLGMHGYKPTDEVADVHDEYRFRVWARMP